VSIGVVISYDAVLDLSALLAQADHALYRAKDNGRNRIEIASIRAHPRSGQARQRRRRPRRERQSGGEIGGVVASANRRISFHFGWRRRSRTFADDEQHRVLFLGAIKMDLLPKWVTKVPAGIGTVPSGSNFVPVPTHHVPLSTVMKRSCG